MHDLISPKLTPGVHCLNLRHKGMYVNAVPDPDESKFYDVVDTAAYWCAETASSAGPDGRAARPDLCDGSRECCKH